MLLLPAGMLAGLIAGLFGVGGGLVFVPVLYFLYSATGSWPEAVRMHVALGTSLGAIVFTGLASLRAHHRHHTIEWPLAIRLGIGLLVGAVLGALVATRLYTGMLKSFFGVFESLVALQMLFGQGYRSGGQAHGELFWPLAGVAIGMVSALLGIGGGTLTVPLLAWSGVPMERAVGTSAACGVPIALAGAAGYLWLGEGSTGFIDPVAMLALGLGGVLLAPLGARLAVRLPRARLRQLFGGFLLLVGLRMIMGS